MAFLARLYAHQLGVGHALMMRIAGGDHRALDRAAAEAVAPTAALRLATIAARLGDRFRRGLLTLTAVTTGPEGGPRKVKGIVWGGPGSNATPLLPANDSSSAAPAATAGHGLLRSDSTTVRARTSLLRVAGEGRGEGRATAGHGVDRSELKRRAA